jgi:LacI family transcriptional regulator
VRTYLSEEGGLRAVQELLADGQVPQAIICGSDAIALGVLSGLRAHGLRVPEDVAVTGFDGLLPGIAPLIDLTTISQPRRRMAVSAVDLLIRRLNGVGGNSQQVVLGHSLRIGTTCGCPSTIAPSSDHSSSNKLTFIV